MPVYTILLNKLCDRIKYTVLHDVAHSSWMALLFISVFLGAIANANVNFCIQICIWKA